jgi:hypothetical protein
LCLKVAIVVVSALLYRKQQQEQKEADQTNRKVRKQISHRIPGHHIDKTFNGNLSNSHNNLKSIRLIVPLDAGTEWMGREEGTRTINIMFDDQSRKIEVRDETSQLVRTIDFVRNQSFSLVKATDTFTVVLKLPKEYDLVIERMMRPDLICILLRLLGLISNEINIT